MKGSRSLKFAAAALALAVLPASRAQAQAQPASTPVHFGVSGGLAIPLGSFSQDAQTGYTIVGMAQGTPVGWPVALRGELGYASFAGKHHTVAQNITSLAVNAVLPVAQQDETPYFIGGIGLHHTSEFAGLASENDFGFNLGGGYRWALADMTSYVELRYVYVAHSGGSRQMLPLTFGVTF